MMRHEGCLLLLLLPPLFSLPFSSLLFSFSSLDNNPLLSAAAAAPPVTDLEGGVLVFSNNRCSKVCSSICGSTLKTCRSLPTSNVTKLFGFFAKRTHDTAALLDSHKVLLLQQLLLLPTTLPAISEDDSSSCLALLLCNRSGGRRSSMSCSLLLLLLPLIPRLLSSQHRKITRCITFPFILTASLLSWGARNFLSSSTAQKIREQRQQQQYVVDKTAETNKSRERVAKVITFFSELIHSWLLLLLLL